MYEKACVQLVQQKDIAGIGSAKGENLTILSKKSPASVGGGSTSLKKEFDQNDRPKKTLEEYEDMIKRSHKLHEDDLVCLSRSDRRKILRQIENQIKRLEKENEKNKTREKE